MIYLSRPISEINEIIHDLSLIDFTNKCSVKRYPLKKKSYHLRNVYKTEKQFTRTCNKENIDGAEILHIHSYASSSQFHRTSCNTSNIFSSLPKKGVIKNITLFPKY